MLIDNLFTETKRALAQIAIDRNREVYDAQQTIFSSILFLTRQV